MAKNIDGYFQLVYASMRRRWWLCCDDDTFAGNSQEIRLLLKYKIEIGLVCCGVLWCGVCMLSCVALVLWQKNELHWTKIKRNGERRDENTSIEMAIREKWASNTKNSLPFCGQFEEHLPNQTQIGCLVLFSKLCNSLHIIWRMPRKSDGVSYTLFHIKCYTFSLLLSFSLMLSIIILCVFEFFSTSFISNANTLLMQVHQAENCRFSFPLFFTLDIFFSFFFRIFVRHVFVFHPHHQIECVNRAV